MISSTRSNPGLVPTVQNRHTQRASDTPTPGAQLFASAARPVESEQPALERSRRDPFGIGSFRMQNPYHLGRRTWDQIKPWMAPLLDRYVRDGGRDENRAEARRRIETAIEGGPESELVLNRLGLRALPPVLPDVALLDVSNNRLVSLPLLPCSLQVLNASGNGLQVLHALPAALRTLNVAGNRLTRLPAALPDGLTAIDASRNALVDLPPAPTALHTLDVSGNGAACLHELAAQRLREAQVRRSVLAPSTYTGLRHMMTLRSCAAGRFEQEASRLWSRMQVSHS